MHVSSTEIKQAFPDSAGRQLLVFAVNAYERFSSASVNEYDVLVDTNGDGIADFAVVAIDYGLISTGSFNGQVASAVLDLNTGVMRVRYLATAPTDGSTLLLPARASDLGITPANPRFAYSVEAYDLFSGSFDGTADAGSFNAFTSAVQTGQYLAVPAGGSASIPVQVNAAEWALTPPAGLMVVTLDDRSGRKQADLLPAAQ